MLCLLSYDITDRKERIVMNIINLLLQKTADGATYLQALIMVFLLCVAIYLVVYGVCEDAKAKAREEAEE